MPNSPILSKNHLLTSARLVLRPLQDRDMDDIVRLLMDNTVKQTYMLTDFDTQEAAEHFFRRLKALSENTEHYLYGICYKNRAVGFINDVETDNGTIEIGYVIHPDFHNLGIGTEALGIIIEELFRIGYKCVKCGYFQGNEASRRVMEKNGMKKIEYEDDLEYRGQLRHCLYYAMENPAASK